MTDDLRAAVARLEQDIEGGPCSLLEGQEGYTPDDRIVDKDDVQAVLAALAQARQDAAQYQRAWKSDHDAVSRRDEEIGKQSKLMGLPMEQPMRPPTDYRALARELAQALDAADDYLKIILEPCSVDCECMLHTMQPLLARAKAAGLLGEEPQPRTKGEQSQ